MVNRKLNGVPWEKVPLPKEEVGLNLRDLRKDKIFSLLLASLLTPILTWRLLTPILTWHSILQGREVLCMWLGVRISNGKSTRFWVDAWMPTSLLINHALRLLSTLQADLSLADYCDEFGSWN